MNDQQTVVIYKFVFLTEMHYYSLQKFNQVVSLCQQLGVENYDIISLPQLIHICYVDIFYSSLMILQKFTKRQTNIHPYKLAVLIRKILPAVFSFFITA